MKLKWVNLFQTGWIYVELEEPVLIDDFAAYLADVYTSFNGTPALVGDVTHEIDPKSILEDPKTLSTILSVGPEQDPTLFLIPGTRKFETPIYTIKQHSFYAPDYRSIEIPEEIKKLSGHLKRMLNNSEVH